MSDGTVGNSPSTSNPAGVFAETAPNVESPFTAAPEGTFPNPGMADTFRQTGEALIVVAQANAESQAQARNFIMENGAAVIDGHTPVNPAPGQLTGNDVGEIADAG